MSNLRTLTSLLVVGGLSISLFAERPLTADKGADRGRAPKAQAADPDQDDATLRRAAMREWWGEYTPEYRQFLMETAQHERERWGDLIPGSGHFLPLKAAGNHWTNLGPTTASYEWNGSTYSAIDSGRPVAIVVDPTDANTIYNATAGGGVWKTTDGGTTWSPITESLGSLSIGYLAMDPSNHNTLYLGLGDAFDGTGIGLVKSTDGGSTWSSVVYLGSSTIINWIGVSSTNSQIVMAATNAGLYRSTDGGATFSKVSIATGTGVDPYCWTLAWGGSTNWTLSLEANQSATSGTGQIWYSSDDGATWTQSTGFTQSTVGLTRASIASAPTSRTTMYAYAAGYSTWGASDGGSDTADMYRSTDAGHTWTALGVTAGYSSAKQSFTTKYTNTNSDSTYPGRILGGQGWYNQMIIVDASDATTFYVGGNLNLAKVTSATTTPSYAVQSNWLAQYTQPYIHADFHAGAFGPDGSLYMGTDGGFFKRTDAVNNTWTYSLNTGLITHLCYSVGSSLNNTSAVITGMQDNGTRVRKGSTSTFDQPMGGDGFGSHIHALDATKMLGTLYYSRVYKSTTSGSTGGSFANAYSGITEAGSSTTGTFITRLTPGLGDSTGNTIYTFSNLKVYKSADYAGSWTATTTAPITSGSIRNVGAAKSNTSVIGVVCSGGRYFLSSNGGSTWSAPTALSNNGNSLSYISFSPANASIVYIASVAASSTVTHLWKSSNSGTSWTAMDTASGFPTGVPVNCILEDFNDSQTLYAGTHEGVYRSTDGGSTWSRFGAGLPLVSVTDLYLAPDSSLLRVSTFGRGIWEFDTKTSTVTASIATPASNVTINSGDSVNFTGSATDLDPASTLSYGWNFGDGATATGASTSHVFTNAGGSDAVYTVTFTATGSTGGLGSTTRSVTVHSADTTAPTPGAPSVTGAHGTITFSATATDNIAVTKVEFYVDGSLAATSVTGSPYTATFNSATLADGPHTLVAKAYDAANNIGTSTSVPFSTDNTGPTVSGTETGTSGTITLNGTASDAGTGVYKLVFYIDNRSIATDWTAPYSATYDSTLLSNGSHTFYVKALDNAGNLTQSATQAFTISNVDTTAPTVSASETGTSGTITLGATASDVQSGISKVVFYIDNVAVSTDYYAPYSATFDSTIIANGSHTLVAKAVDKAGNVGTSTSIPFTISNANPDTTAPTVSASVTGTTGTITFNATATDNGIIHKVVFYIDNVNVGEDPTAPYSLSYNSALLTNGTHTLLVKALDLAGNVGSTTTSFSVSN